MGYAILAVMFLIGWIQGGYRVDTESIFRKSFWHDGLIMMWFWPIVVIFFLAEVVKVLRKRVHLLP